MRAVLLATALCALGAIVSVTFDLGDWLTFICAIPAGIGGALLGDRGMGWLIEHGYARTPWDGR